ncbi:MAG: sensor histidine kinase [Candidatus Competibacterales bacterium]
MSSPQVSPAGPGRPGKTVRPPPHTGGVRLFRTTAFRLSLAYAASFSLLFATGLGVIYWFTAHHILDQVDERLGLETGVLLQRYHQSALPDLLETVRRRSDEDGRRRQIFFYLLTGPDARQLTGGPFTWPAKLKGQHPPGHQRFATLTLGEVFNSPLESPVHNTPVRVLVTDLVGGYRLLVGSDLHAETALLRRTLGVVLGVSAVTLLLTLVGSISMGQRTLRQIDAVSRTAGEIMAGDLSRRIPITERESEFDELNGKLNAMLERIEQLMAAMRQVTDNVAHDLRSPLSRLRNRLEVTLLEPRSDGEYREVIGQTLEDADGLLKTFNALLSIAQAEAGVRRNDWQPVDLTGLVADLDELYAAAAEDKGIRWACHSAEGMTVMGNRPLLAQALANLLDNAVKYTPVNGSITLTLAPARQSGRKANGQTPRGPRLTVADSGPGIPAAQRQRVLERFVRLDTARSQPGNGLGLSLVNAVAKLHGATLELDDNDPGLRVSLAFPAFYSA